MLGGGAATCGDIATVGGCCPRSAAAKAVASQASQQEGPPEAVLCDFFSSLTSVGIVAVYGLMEVANGSAVEGNSLP